ncbi:MAG: hypothetical protein BroJett022_00280 [Actinomycetes bacterium]|nr:MAG: hypothetical protein BroJett022_00280 [Actinomycetes bacterium]
MGFAGGNGATARPGRAGRGATEALPGRAWLDVPPGRRRSRFERAYRDHHRGLYRYCLTMLGDAEDAADALQATMEAALRGLAGEERRIALVPWLYRIARNEAITMLRRRERRPIATGLPADVAAADPRGDVVAITSSRARLRELLADLGALPERQRSALMMRELGGLAIADVAAALDCSEAAVRQAVYEARISLTGFAAGRALDCERVRREISARDGRRLRSRELRSHLRTCRDCARFRAEIEGRRRELASACPALPAAAAGTLLGTVLKGGAGGLSTGGGAASTLGGGLIAGPALGGGAAKATVIVAAAALTAAGIATAPPTAEPPRASGGDGDPAVTAAAPVGSVVVPRPAAARSRSGGGAEAPGEDGSKRPLDGATGQRAAVASDDPPGPDPGGAAADGAVEPAAVEPADGAVEPADGAVELADGATAAGPRLLRARMGTARRAASIPRRALRLLRRLPRDRLSDAVTVTLRRLRPEAAPRARASLAAALRRVRLGPGIGYDAATIRSLKEVNQQRPAGPSARREEGSDETAADDRGDRRHGDRGWRDAGRGDRGHRPSPQGRGGGEAGLRGAGEGAPPCVPPPLRAAGGGDAAMRAGEAAECGAGHPRGGPPLPNRATAPPGRVPEEVRGRAG